MTPEQQNWMLRAQENLAATRLLLHKNCYDAAVSCAYYAVFYVAKAIVLTDNIVSNRSRRIIAAFGQYFAKTGRIPAEFQQLLVTAHQQRILSDYDMDVMMTVADAEAQLDRTEKFIQMGERFFTSPPTTTSSEPDER